MAGIIAEDVIAEVRSRSDIVQIIGQSVSLRRSGANFLGLCPFHDEKTPSFNVNPARQFYHCFGCHESGDVFSFLMKVEGRSFVDVVEDLASRASVEVRYEGGNRGAAKERQRKRSERQSGLTLNDKVRTLYRSLLEGQGGGPARKYLEERGISQETAAAFHLGYAPRSGSVVTNMLQREKVPPAFAEKLGLISQRRGDRKGYYDRFWDRLIFPVSGAGKEVLGFGGRKLGDGDGPKYINSPESFVYHKGKALYGLEQASRAIRSEGESLLVEGNIDVIQMYQHGYCNTVAPMGTALTTQQVQLLRRLAERTVAIFDGDDAGQTAAVKSVPMLVSGGLEARIATMPAGLDPDDLLRSEGPEAVAKIIKESMPAVDFLVAYHRQRMEDSIPGRARLLEQVAPVVAKLGSQVARELYAGKLASMLVVDQDVVQRAIRGERRANLEAAFKEEKGAAQRGSPGPGKTAPARLTGADRTGFKVIGILNEHPHLTWKAEEAQLTSFLTNQALHATYNAALHMLREEGAITASKLLEQTAVELRDDLARVIIDREWASEDAEADPTRALDDCIRDLQALKIKKELDEVTEHIKDAGRQGDIELCKILFQRQHELKIELRELQR